jgi:hypothetical protein
MGSLKKKRKEVKVKNIYSKLTSIRFRVGKRIYEVDFSEELILKKDIHSEIEKIPSIMGYLGPIISILEEEYNNKNDLKKKIEADIDEIQRNAGMTGEARIDRAIKRDHRWIEACVAVNKAKAEFEKSKYIYASLMKKHESAMSRGSDIRKVPTDSIISRSKKDIITFNSKKV